MCGIAGIIHKGKSTNVGSQMQQMLQSLKHRGPDSTGYALYGSGGSKDYILRFKVGENVKEGSSAVMEDESLYDQRRNDVNEKIIEAGGKIIKQETVPILPTDTLEVLTERIHKAEYYLLPQVINEL